MLEKQLLLMRLGFWLMISNLLWHGTVFLSTKVKLLARGFLRTQGRVAGEVAMSPAYSVLMNLEYLLRFHNIYVY